MLINRDELEGHESRDVLLGGDSNKYKWGLFEGKNDKEDYILNSSSDEEE